MALDEQSCGHGVSPPNVGHQPRYALTPPQVDKIYISDPQMTHPLHSMSRAAAMGSAPRMSGTSRAMPSSASHSRSEARSKSSTASTAVSLRSTDAPLFVTDNR